MAPRLPSRLGVAIDPPTRALVAPARDKRARERFRALFSSSPMGAALCRCDGVVLESNDALLELFVDTGIDIVGLPLFDLGPPLLQGQDPADWASELDSVANGTADAARTTLSLPGQDGAHRPVEIVVVQIDLAGRDYLLAHLRDITGRRTERQRLVYLATHDALTGLANRELVQQRLAAALDRAVVTQRPVAALYLDLDHFKSINDTHGHHVGDALLAALGERLATALRSSDSAGRLGGDEFLIVAPDVPDATALRELQRRVEATLCEPVEVDGLSLELRPSIGAVLSREAEQAASVMRRADASMYAAKRARRRRYPVAPSVDPAASRGASQAQRQIAWEQARVAGRP